MTSIAAALVIAVAGGLLGVKLKIPAGAMVFSMVAVGLFNILIGHAALPSQTRFFTQAIAGAFIGLSIDRRLVDGFRQLILSAVLVAVCMLSAGLLLGNIIHVLFGMDLLTALLSNAAGGIVDMTLISMDMGADSSKVAVMHTIRLVAAVAICPPLMRLLVNRFDPQSAHGEKPPEAPLPPRELRLKKSLLVLGIGLAAATIGIWVPIPASSLVFSMVAVAVFNLLRSEAYIQPWVRKAAQMLAGALVGQELNKDQLMGFVELIFPVIVMVVGYILFNILIGFLLHRLCKLDLTTALFAAVPAGLSDMALIASEVGGNGPRVAILQIVRLVAVVAIFPSIVQLLI